LAGNAAVKARFAADSVDGQYRPIFAGEALDMIHAVASAASVVERLVIEAKAALTSRSPALLAVNARA
jgi:hypothetical protein